MKTSVYNTPAHLITHKVHVDVAGCGGTGSQVLSLLARSHHALQQCGHPGLHVRAYDPDIISNANVGRHAFLPADVNYPKATLAIDRINRAFGLNWEAYPTIFPPGVTSLTHRVILSCTDNGESRQNIAHNVQQQACHWLDCGNFQSHGQVFLGEGKRMSKLPRLLTVAECYPEILKDTPNEPSCSVVESLERQDLLVNTLCATLACQILWQMLRHGHLAHQGFFFNLTTGVVPIPFQKVLNRKKKKSCQRKNTPPENLAA